MDSIYLLSILEEGIILSRGERVWFYGWYEVGRIYEDFSKWQH
jgi:hypothetical protein